jgi:hypothetical protein
MPDPVREVAQDRSRLHNDLPDEPAELRGDWKHPDWRLQLVFCVLLVCVLSCSAFSKVTPADRAEAYDAQARTTELACKAYAFDRASGLVGDVPNMAKLCAGQ